MSRALKVFPITVQVPYYEAPWSLALSQHLFAWEGISQGLFSAPVLGTLCLGLVAKEVTGVQDSQRARGPRKMHAPALHRIRPFLGKVVRISKADHCLAPRAQAQAISRKEGGWRACHLQRKVGAHVFQAGLGHQIWVGSPSLTLSGSNRLVFLSGAFETQGGKTDLSQCHPACWERKEESWHSLWPSNIGGNKHFPSLHFICSKAWTHVGRQFKYLFLKSAWDIGNIIKSSNFKHTVWWVLT